MSGKGPEKENREKNVPGQELGSTECLSLEQPRRNAMTREAGLGGGHGVSPRQGEVLHFILCTVRSHGMFWKWE